MSRTTNLAINWIELGLVPDSVIRTGIRRLLKERVAEIRADDTTAAAEITELFVQELRQAPVAWLAEKANEQHYEVPAGFFREVLGPHLKYSSCLWPAGVNTLGDAESAALEATCAHAAIGDGQEILELGCGWGSLTLWMAERYPHSRVTAVSNSNSQRTYIEAQAAKLGRSNIRVLTRDMNEFEIPDRFDRVVSVEMFEHMRNWPELFRRIRQWLKPEGRFFMHVFAHRSVPYAFVEKDASDWMSRHFFSGGMMPSDDLAFRFQDDLRLERHWRWDGTHYQRTAEAWLANLTARRQAARPLLEQTYGAAEAAIWWMRWRIFFMSCAELFGYNQGQEWYVSHYLFQRR